MILQVLSNLLRQLSRVENRRSLVAHLARSNRLWTWVDKRLYIRVPRDAVSSAGAGSWVYRRVFCRGTADSHRVHAFVPDLGRLGNAVVRISAAIVIAQENGWGGLVLPRAGHFPAYRGLMASEPVEYGTLRVSFGDGRRQSRLTPVYLVRREFARGQPEPSPVARDAVGVLVPAIFGNLGADSRVQDNDLVVHVRAGDIFRRENVGNWGQPPASYYDLIVRSKSWSKVVVVSEDRSSPVVPRIESFCRARGINYEFQSGDLTEDLSVLTGARTLVVGRGTFAPAVALLSTNLSDVYYFEDRFESSFLSSRISVWKVIDRRGEYRSKVLGGNWTNSPEQRELMGSYPSKFLSVEPENDRTRSH